MPRHELGSALRVNVRGIDGAEVDTEASASCIVRHSSRGRCCAETDQRTGLTHNDLRIEVEWTSDADGDWIARK